MPARRLRTSFLVSCLVWGGLLAAPAAHAQTLSGEADKLDRPRLGGVVRNAGPIKVGRAVITPGGTVRVLLCTRCRRRRDVANYEGLVIPPKCGGCGGLERPDVVLFGEWLPERAVEVMQRELAEGFDLVLTVGTTSVFPYIAGPVVAARRAGIPTVEVNPGTSEVSRLVDVRIRAGAAEALAALDAALG